MAFGFNNFKEISNKETAKKSDLTSFKHTHALATLRFISLLILLSCLSSDASHIAHHVVVVAWFWFAVSDKVPKIDVYDSVLVRATLSDAVCVHLSDVRGFRTNHWLSNVKLFLGTVCCLCALVAQFYPKPFPANYWVIVVTASM